MDNLTHTLTAVAISQAGLNRKTRFATLTVILAGNAPDIDILARIENSVSYLKYHRGITHSLLGITVLAAAVALVVYALTRQVRPKTGLPFSWRWTLIAAWIGAASHVLMDLTNSYGVRPFMPFSSRWYAWDIMFIFDPLLLGMLVLGLGMPAILRLVSEEVGAKRARPRWGAIFALCVMVGLWGLRDFAHRRVIGYLNAHNYGDQNPLRLGAFPSPANPFSWTGVVETESAFHILPADALADDIDLDADRVFHKPEPSPVLNAALKTRTGRIFSNFARFPWAQVQENDDGFFVSIQDLRFTGGLASTRNFAMDVELDKSLRVQSEFFNFVSPQRRTGL